MNSALSPMPQPASSTRPEKQPRNTRSRTNFWGLREGEQQAGRCSGAGLRAVQMSFGEALVVSCALQRIAGS